MKRYLRLLALSGVLALVAAACGGDEGGGGGGGDQDLQRGGTMQIAMESDVDDAFDPQKEYYQVSWGLFRCCLLRTLVSYEGVPGEDGGNELVPDLSELPEVSEDQTTWTFRLKEGIKFGPPYADQEIVADDFINAMEREANPAVSAGYSFYYSIIEGFDSYGCGLLTEEERAAEDSGC
ncbi:MAG TPA: ABC transporter substrate-binding protein, partial [Actinomycetota bacterium]|nr:ABC transporter substrate-binding protein [Actinomycetota bacterium]